jgi:sugar lactone lactonase YvrE
VKAQTIAELFLDARATLGEGALWDSKHRTLYWVDIIEKKLFVFDPSTKKNRAIDVGQFIGTVVPRQSGGVMLALHHGFFALDLETEKLTPIADPEKDLPDNRFNDGKCDPAGRFWAGTMSLVGKKNTGSLYRLDTNLSVHRMLDSVTTSNGITWSLDAKTMYYIDTPTRRVDAFDYDNETGAIKNRRPVVTLPETDGYPDGMTIDAEGMLWVAHWAGGRVSRWNPSSGKLLQTISLPVSRVTSCAFGGEKLDQLFITTAQIGRAGQMPPHHEPHAGAIFVAQPGTTGTPACLFAG